MRKLMGRITCALLLIWGAVLFSLLVGTPRVEADGGAPQLAYAVGTARGISVIDIAQRRVTSTLSLGGQPRMALLSLDGSTLYVAQPTLGRVAMIAVQSGKTICTASLPGQPDLLALSIDSTVLYVAGQGDSSVRALNPATCALERAFETRQPVYGLAVAASTAASATPETPNQLWVVGETGLTVFDASGRLLGTVPVAGGPQYISIPTGGLTAYVTTRQGSIVAVDLNTRQVIRALLSGGQYGQMDYNAVTGEIYVPDHQHNLLDVLTPITASTVVMPHEPARQFTLSSAPQSVAITSDGQLGFVALASGQVLMLDIPGRSIITSINVTGTPRFIITGVYPPAPTTPVPASSFPAAPSVAPLPLIGLLVLVCAGLCGSFWLLWRRARK